MLLTNNPSIEVVTCILTAAFSCFTIYKTIQFFYYPTVTNNSDFSPVSGSSTIKPTNLDSPSPASEVDSLTSTVTSNTIPLPIPDPTPIMVPAPQTVPAPTTGTVINCFDKALDGTTYLFAIIGDTAQNMNPEFINFFM
jgi:hypothetical protein